MIVGIGCDLTEIYRVKKALTIEKFAARTGLRGGKLIDIEVYNDCMGKPSLRLSGYFATLAEERGVKEIYLSLSHTKELAMAQVVLEG